MTLFNYSHPTPPSTCCRSPSQLSRRLPPPRARHATPTNPAVPRGIIYGVEGELSSLQVDRPSTTSFLYLFLLVFVLVVVVLGQ